MTEIERVYRTEYGEIHYWLYCAESSAPWLVMLPGLTADHHLFDKQIEQLSEKYNCFVWDAPAHGQSRPFALKFSMVDMAQYLHEIFTIEGIKCPILIGQSLGGYIAQVYMGQHPEVVSGFISIDSCSMKRNYYTWWELALLKRTKWMYMSIPWNWLIKWGSKGTAETTYGRELMKRTMESYQKVEYCELADHGYRLFAEAVEAQLDYEIKCPALLICGEKDGAGSAKRYNRQWAKQDGLPLVWVPNAGHNSNTDAADQINDLIESFVDCMK